MKRGAVTALSRLVLAGALLAAVALLNRRDEAPLDAAPAAGAAGADPAQVARGTYLAQVGNCAGCHTARGGAAYAGGSALATPFGTVYSANLTPDATGLGGWTEPAFWRALHNGRSADGRWLVPACPYPNFTHVTRDDARDLFAFLRSLQPVVQHNRPHALRFPYGTQPALAVWRALYFRPGAPPQDPAQPAAWHRGAYLVAGLGHCSACHGGRDAWGGGVGATVLHGGVVPMQGWVAPALDDPAQAGVMDWTLEEAAALLQTGSNRHASASGPMAMVVARSTQHLRDDDARAIAVFLQSLPVRRTVAGVAPAPPAEQQALGARVYERHCADCHGAQGEGRVGAAPALAGNRAVTLAAPDNLLKTVLGGGFAASTAAHPRPHGMPPFATVLDNAEVAAVVSHLRSQWGHRAAPVTALQADRQRGGW